MINFCSLDGVNPSMLEGLWRNCLDASKAYTLFGFFLVSFRGITFVPLTYMYMFQPVLLFRWSP